MAQKFVTPITIKQLSTAGSDGLTIYVDADSYARLQIQGGGRLVWGDGSAAGDVNLYRDAADVLKTDDTLKVPALFIDGIEVDTSGATSNQVLSYNGTKFVPAAAAAGGSSVTVSDTAPVSPTAGDVWYESDTGILFVRYDSYWVEVGGDVGAAGSSTLDGLTDVVITSPATTQFVRYNGTNWVNATIVAGDVPTLNQNTTGSAATVTTNANLTGGVTSVGNAATVITNANLTGDVTSIGNATTLTNAPVIARVLTGYVSGSGTVAATDSILQAVQKLNGNDALKADLISPSFTTPILGVATGTSFNSITGLSSTTPIVDGTAAVGTGTTTARGDHVHPTDTSRAPLSSPTFTGTPLSTTAAVDTNTTQIATTAYVVGQGYAKLASPTFTGTVTVPTPTNSTDAVTKAYADAITQSLDIKDSVRVASTVNIAVASALTNTSTIDGVVVATGDRVLLKNQTAGAENGIYVVVASGAASRSTDANTSAKVTSGMYVFVSEGTVSADMGYVLTTNDAITLGTTSLSFTQFSGAGQITAGTGLSKSGNTLSIDTAVTANLTTAQTLTNKTLTSPVINTPTGIVKGDIGLGNVDNTSNATERAATATLANKTLTTPILGVATATSINKVTLTAPATGSTLTIAEGKTLTASNTLTLTGTDASSVAFGAGGTVAYTSVTTLSSLISVGTIGTGIWQGTAIAGQYGGTGVANTGKTITLGGNLTTSGAFTTTLTATANTSVTLPTSGTLTTTGKAIAMAIVFGS